MYIYLVSDGVRGGEKERKWRARRKVGKGKCKKKSEDKERDKEKRTKKENSKGKEEGGVTHFLKTRSDT